MQDTPYNPVDKNPADKVRQFTVGPDDDGVRLDRWFKRHLPLIGFAMVSRWARTGQIRVDGARADPADRLTTGQVLRVPPGGLTPTVNGKPAPRPRKPLTPEQISKAADMLLVTTPSALVLNKPPGLATQGGSGTFEHVDGLLDAYADDDMPRPRLVHRLDKDTSGVLLIARTPGSAAFFSKRFSGRSARKIYWALIVGAPSIEQGEINLPLAKQPGSGGEKMMVDEAVVDCKPTGQPARTRYRVIDRAGNRAAWVELQPLTGRTHQLRVHMAAIGHPIVGDGKYGGPEAFLSGSISRKMHLHARRLLIDAPQGEVIDATAPLPDHFAASLAQLGFSEVDGNNMPEPMRAPEAEIQKTAAKAHAKQYRKERRGERKGRVSGDRGPAGKAKIVAKPPSKTKAKPTAARATGPSKTRNAPAAKGSSPKGRFRP
ncbi:MAG: hypothetical protein RLY97_1410 [Pseudomonadota bacterium]